MEIGKPRRVIRVEPVHAPPVKVEPPAAPAPVRKP
jgi:hypothetical protein